MNMTHTKKFLLIALALANGWLAGAQTNDAASATDYASFSRVIAERNIFDPNRVAHTPGAKRTAYRPRTRSAAPAAPAFSLVGTMSYEKGRFAFFSGNSADLKKILELDGSIAGYTVAEIAPTQVKLQSADKKILALKIGDTLRQESGHWELAAQGETPAPAGTTETAAAAAAEEGATPAAPEAPANPAAGNSAASDILKRLMQKREQENK